MEPLVEMGFEFGRSLQLSGTICDLNGDLVRGQFQCTLEEYCNTLNTADIGGTYTCVGDLERGFSVIEQNIHCFEPGSATSWLQANDRVCYTLNDRSDYFQTTTVRRSFDIDFYEGFNFNYFAEAEVCQDNIEQQCACAASLEGRPCNSCQVCDDGFPNPIANAYLYALDCSNIAVGLTRTCDPTFSWGDFFERVEESELAPLVSQPMNPSSVQTQAPVPAPIGGVNEGVIEDVDSSTPSDKSLSAAALGGIVGGAAGTGLALVLAVVLVVVFRQNGGPRGKESSESNQTAGPPDTTEAVEANQPPSPRPVMAQVVLLDDQRPTTKSDKPGFKDQFRA